MTTMNENQSAKETLTIAVYTVKLALRQLTAALADMEKVVSIVSAEKRDVTTVENTTDQFTENTQKKSRRSKKNSDLVLPTAATTKDSEAQDLGTTTTIPKSENKLSETDSGETQKVSSVESSVVTKKRGASPEVLAKARAALAARRKAESDKNNPPKSAPLNKWPFPTSTVVNKKNDAREETSSNT